MDIKVSPLTYLEQMMLAADIVSPAMSDAGWNTAIVAASVREIDGRIVMRPKHSAHIRAIIKQLGDDGFKKARREFHSFSIPRDDNLTATVDPASTIELWDLSEYSGRLFDLPPWRGIAVLAVSVRNFNGMDLDFPSSVPELYARVEMLGWQGIELAVADVRAEKERADDLAAKEPPKGN